METIGYPLNKEILQRWVVALRSGLYKQGHNHLHSDDNYCCLGVLCDIIDPSKWKYEEESNKYFYEENGGCLPMSIMILTGLEPNAELPNGKSYGDSYSLIGLNDTERYTFEQIAEVIENDFINTP